MMTVTLHLNFRGSAKATLAFYGQVDGSAVTWMEPVTEEQYGAVVPRYLLGAWPARRS